MSPGLQLVLVPLTSLGVFIGLAVLLNAWDWVRRAMIRRWWRLNSLQARARERGWYRELPAESIVWVDPSRHPGLLLVCHQVEGGRWRRFMGEREFFNNEADALEAALKENP